MLCKNCGVFYGTIKLVSLMHHPLKYASPPPEHITLSDIRIGQMPPLLTRLCLCLSPLVQFFSAWVLVCSELQSGSRSFIQNQMRVWQRLHLRHFSARQLGLGKSSVSSRCLFSPTFVVVSRGTTAHRAHCVLFSGSPMSTRRCLRAFPSLFAFSSCFILFPTKQPDNVLMHRNSFAFSNGKNKSAH